MKTLKCPFTTWFQLRKSHTLFHFVPWLHSIVWFIIVANNWNIKRVSMYLSSAISEKLISDTSHTLAFYFQRKLCNSTFEISLLSFYKVHRTDTFLLCELFRLKNAKKKLLIVLVKMPRTSDIVVTWSLFLLLIYTFFIFFILPFIFVQMGNMYFLTLWRTRFISIIRTTYFTLGLYIYMKQLHMLSDVRENKCIPKNLYTFVTKPNESIKIF